MDQAGAKRTAEEVGALGRRAVAVATDVTSRADLRAMVDRAKADFGRIDILINNAGILRDKMSFNMDEAEWDAVIAVHLKGHFAPTRWAAAYWREQHKAGVAKSRNLVHTSSTSGLLANPGQANYGAAKSGIATMSQICAKELVRYGVKSNCIAPAARTRLTLATPGLGDMIQAPDDSGAFDVWDPANVSPFVVWLGSGECDVTGRAFEMSGGEVCVMNGWSRGPAVDEGRAIDIGAWRQANLGEQHSITTRAHPFCFHVTGDFVAYLSFGAVELRGQTQIA
jgi:NAD(P)-dependent dehydrogenase (short-subunit alcohol dehydrogenase family)